MIVLILDRDLRMTGMTDQVAGLIVAEAAYTCNLTVPMREWMDKGQDDGFVAFEELTGGWGLYRVQTVSASTDNAMAAIYAESIGYDLLTAPYILDKRPTNISAGAALPIILEGTGWEVGRITTTGLASTTWYDCSRLEALNDLAKVWGVRYGFRVAVSGNAVTHKYVDLISAAPVWRGKRYRAGKDLTITKRNIDNRSLITALYGRGKGEQSGDGYGRRIKFVDVVWSKADGDPADKPYGQDYVFDADAAEIYGMRYGLATFQDIEDPEELLRATWAQLQTLKAPQLNYELTVADLERMGYPHEAVRVGDRCLIVIDELGIEAAAAISAIDRDYVNPGATKVTFGQPSGKLSARIAQGAKTWDRAAALNPTGTVPTDMITGALDVAKTQLQSSQTNFATDSTGAFVWTAADGGSAMRITGDGLQIASSKIGDDWDWTVAATGEGLVATLITAGVLNADLIKAGLLASVNGKTWIDMVNGTFSFGDGAITFDGTTFAVSPKGVIPMQDTAPADPALDALWINTAVNPNTLMRWDGEMWQETGNDLSGYATTSEVGGAVDGLYDALSQASQHADATYATKDGVTTQISTAMTQTAQSIEMRFTSIEQLVEQIGGDSSGNYDLLNRYIRFQDGHIILGEEGNDFTMDISNDRISFLQSGTEVAYMSNSKLYITQGEILDSLRLGNYAFTPRANGNLSFTWVGGDGA